jgi:ankyrin repeat protein
MNRPDLVEILVRAGAPLSTPYAHSAHTALSWGITVGSMEAARKLVDLGCAPDLFCAAGLGLLDVLKGFWPNGTLRPHPSATGSSRYAENGDRLPCPPPNDADQVSDALYIACRSNRADAARWLLDHGADPNWRGFCGATCLAWAEFAGNPELAALLRERGGSDELRDSEFRATPKVFGLMVLTAWGFPQRLRARLTADPSLVDSRGGWGTLLNAAAFNGQIETAKVLLEFGANKTALNAAGLTATQMSASRGHKELAELLA